MEIRQTDRFSEWLRKLRDRTAKARINVALRRCELSGQMVGDIKPVGDEVFEMRFHFGPGYRVYFWQDGPTVVLLLMGGDKSSQQRDIDKSKAIKAELEKEGT